MDGSGCSGLALDSCHWWGALDYSELAVVGALGLPWVWQPWVVTKKKGVDSYVAQQLHNTFFRVIDVSLEFMLVQVSFWNLKLSFPF